MKSHLVLLLPFLLTPVAAESLTGPVTLTAPYFSGDSFGVEVTGPLLLQSTARSITFTARAWWLREIRLTAPGNYIMNGQMPAGLRVVGPPTGFATIRFTDLVEFPLTYRIDGNVRVLGPLEPNPIEREPRPTTPTSHFLQAFPGMAAAAPLSNVSTRVTLASQQTATVGLVVGGERWQRVLVRAIGPSLRQFGVTNPHPNPTLTVREFNTVRGSDDDWTAWDEMHNIFAALGAFPLERGTRDAVLLIDLRPGNYTVQVQGVSPTDAGEVLIEIYYVD